GRHAAPDDRVPERRAAAPGGARRGFADADRGRFSGVDGRGDGSGPPVHRPLGTGQAGAGRCPGGAPRSAGALNRRRPGDSGRGDPDGGSPALAHVPGSAGSGAGPVAGGGQSVGGARTAGPAPEGSAPLVALRRADPVPVADAHPLGGSAGRGRRGGGERCRGGVPRHARHGRRRCRRADDGPAQRPPGQAARAGVPAPARARFGRGRTARGEGRDAAVACL
ncbi:MAG: hypothetical protein AVDCRST_MAG57-3372, partial [uncultured Blastococcus sp.]